MVERMNEIEVIYRFLACIAIMAYNPARKKQYFSCHHSLNLRISIFFLFDASWVNVTDKFQVRDDQRFWACRSHLVDCSGLPLLTAVVTEVYNNH